MKKPVYIAVTRRIKPGHEAEFQQALREFFQSSFGEAGVHGASMLVPPPGSSSSEYGILRAFASEQERNAFYDSPMFKEWEARVRPLTEGDPVHRELTGLEAWFRSAEMPPPRWKMAVLTWVGVWPISMAVPALLSLLMGNSVPQVIFAGAVAAGIVLVLTWGVMPVLAKLAQPWLRSKS